MNIASLPRYPSHDSGAPSQLGGLEDRDQRGEALLAGCLVTLGVLATLAYFAFKLLAAGGFVLGPWYA